MPLSARSQHSTLTQFLIEERRKYPGASGDFNALILDIALACKAIARGVAFGELGQVLGDHAKDGAGAVNVHTNYDRSAKAHCCNCQCGYRSATSTPGCSGSVGANARAHIGLSRTQKEIIRILRHFVCSLKSLTG
jgi:hypothetical protein